MRIILQYTRVNGDVIIIHQIRDVLLMEFGATLVKRGYLRAQKDAAAVVAARWKAEDDERFAGSRVHLATQSSIEQLRAEDGRLACGQRAALLTKDRWLAKWMPVFSADKVTCPECRKVLGE